VRKHLTQLQKQEIRTSSWNISFFKNTENSLIFKIAESFSGLGFFIPLSSARFLNSRAKKMLKS
jgi:hypothetical protein